VQYQVRWSPTARKHLLALDKPARKQVGSAVDKLAENPRPRDVKALVGMPGVLRVRTGDYRVLYSIDDDKREVWIEDVRHRSKAYGGH
jgi:mRNA interferase RelE/StbE